MTVKPPETPAETLTDSQKLDRLLKVADHLDVMVHEVHGFIHENKPHLEKALNFMEPGRAMRAYLAGRPKAGRHDGQG